MLTAFICLNFCSTFLQASATTDFQGNGNVRDYPLQAGLDYKVAERVTVLAVVECIAPSTTGERRYSPIGTTTGPADSVEARLSQLRPKDRVVAESVRVIDSTSMRPGTKVTVVTPFGRERAAFQMQPGARYLLLGGVAKDGLLAVPAGIDATGVQATPALAADEVSGWAVFETKAQSLSKGIDRADQIVNSIADTLTGATDAEARRTMAWFESCGYPGGGRGTNPSGRADFPTSLRLRSLADHASSDYQRAKIYQVLCEWEVAGAEGPFAQALVAISRNPLAYTTPGDFLLGGVFGYSAAYALDHPGYKAYAMDGNMWADSVVNAKSKPIQTFLLMNLGGRTDLTHDKALARLLFGTDDSIGQAVAAHLAWNQNRPDLQPKMQDVAGRPVWMNRQIVTQAWTSRFGIAVP